MKRKINQLHETLEILVKEVKTVQNTNGDLKNELQKVLSENTKLKNMIAKKGMIEKTVVPQTSDTASPVIPSLIIGEFMIRDIKHDDETKLQVICIPGAKLNQISEKMSKCVSEKKMFDTIYVTACTSDCSVAENSVDDINKKVSDVIIHAKTISKKIVFSSVLPRTDDGPTQLKLENFNLSLKELCNNSQNVNFVDNDCYFKVADGSTNDALLLNDGLHLSFKGTEKTYFSPLSVSYSA